MGGGSQEEEGDYRILYEARQYLRSYVLFMGNWTDIGYSLSLQLFLCTVAQGIVKQYYFVCGAQDMANLAWHWLATWC